MFTGKSTYCRKILVFVLIFLHLPPLFTQEIDVPVDIQYPLLLKILTFDRNYRKKVDKVLRIGILYQEESQRSVQVKNELIGIIRNSSLLSVDHIPVEYHALNSDADDLSSLLHSTKINVLYVTPMRMVKINDISEYCRNHGILSFSGVTEYVEKGLSLGITLKADKPQIVINVRSARAEGSDFDARLLKLSRIIE